MAVRIDEVDGPVRSHSHKGISVVWDDIQFPIFTGRVPAVGAPTWETFTTNTKAYAFDVDDYIDLEANEMAHWWEEGQSDCGMHIHFAIKTAQVTGVNRFAKFQLWIAYADVGDAWTEVTLSAEKTIPTASSALENFLLDMGDLDLTGKLIGTQVCVRVKRIAATGGTEYADDVYITQVGLHAKANSNGSANETTK